MSPQATARDERVRNRGVKRKLQDIEPVTISDDEEFAHVPEVGCDIEFVVCRENEDDNNTIQSSDVTSPVTTATVSTQTPSYPMYSIENFINDDAGIHFYTGLENYSRFEFVLRSLGPAAYHLEYTSHRVENLSIPNQFFMTMMKLR